MKIVTALLLSLTLCGLASPRASADPAPSAAALTAQAVELAAQGDHAGAAQAYEAAAAQGLANGHLFYNLGISYYRQGRVGDAVAAFLAARRLLPRDADVAANLRFTLARIGDRLDAEPPPSAPRAALFFLDLVTLRELALATTVLAVLGGLLLGAASLASRLRPARPAAWTALGLAALAGVAAAAKTQRSEPWGAVKADTARVHSGPSDGDTVLFELKAGAPLLVESKERGFYRVALSDGKKGWIAGNGVSLFDTGEL